MLTDSGSPPQGYELAEDEVKISLDRFRSEYTNDDGSAKYGVHSPPFNPLKASTN